MAITKQKKVELIDSMVKRLKGAKSIVFVSFNALTVSETKMLRRKLLADKVGYFVAKKTLAKRVLTSLSAKGDMPELPGQLAIVYGDDLLAPARETYAFQNTPREKGSISIVGGIFDGEFKNQAEMLLIANIPPLQVLRGQFVNIINSPIQRFVIAMEEIRKSKGGGAIESIKSESPKSKVGADAENPSEAPATEEAVVEAVVAAAEVVEAPAVEVVVGAPTTEVMVEIVPEAETTA